MEEKNKIDSSKWWMIIALLCLGILLGMIFQVKVISGMEWMLDKTSTCTMFNKTAGLECEVFWCNNVQDGSYNLTKEVCFIGTNTTIYVNITNSSNYTMGEIDKLFDEWYKNITKVFNETRNISSETYYNKTEIEFILNNKTGTLRDSIMDNYATKMEVINLSPIKETSSGIDNSTLILIIFIVCAFGGMFFLQTRTNKEIPTAFQRGEAKTEFRKLQSQKTTGELGVEHNLKVVMDKLDKLEKEKAKEKPKKKVVEEEPEEEEENQEEEE